MKCPNCGWQFEKKPKTGENVRHCATCGRGWFILNTTKSKEAKAIPDPKDELLELRVALKASESMRLSAEEAHQKEIDENRSHQRMERAISQAVEMKRRLDKATNGFYSIIMTSGEETRKYHRWSAEKQVQVLDEIAHEYKEKIADYRTIGKVVEDIRSETPCL